MKLSFKDFFSITSFFIKECSLTFATWKGNIYWYEHLVIHFISVSDQGDFSFVPKMSKGYIFYLESIKYLERSQTCSF